MPVSKRSSTCVSARSRFGLTPRKAPICRIQSCCMRRASSARKSRNARSEAASLRAPNNSSGSNPSASREALRTSSFRGVNRAGFAAPSSDSKYSSARLTPSQSKRSISVFTPCDTARKQSRLVRFMSFRQSSCASCNRAVFSRHSGCWFQNVSLTCGSSSHA